MRDKVQLSPDKLFGFSIQPRLRSLDVFNEHTHPIPLHTPTPPELLMRNNSEISRAHLSERNYKASRGAVEITNGRCETI